MLETVLPAIKLAIEQVPNMLFAMLAFAYLARQNERVIAVMHQANERQFELLSRLCQKCVEANDHE